MQRWLNALPYNTEKGGETLRSFRGVVRTRHGALPRGGALGRGRSSSSIAIRRSSSASSRSTCSITSSSSTARPPDGDRSRARAIPGLHGRKPVFATPRALALSYFESYIDFTGGIKAYAVVDLRVLGDYDWRLSEKNVWKVEQMLLDWPHRTDSSSSDARAGAMRRRYRAFREAHGYKPWKFYTRPRALDAAAARIRERSAD